MSKQRTKYVCQVCGYNSPKWLGKCPDCGSWNSFTEEFVDTDRRKVTKEVKNTTGRALPLKEVESRTDERIRTGIAELDRVLGGGITQGSVMLIGGDPGIGKSTLMLQIGDKIKDKKILYVSGEESASQIKMRAERLNFDLPNMYVLSETDLDVITAVVENERPDLFIIDSVQTVYRPEIESAPGTVSQLRESTSMISRVAKRTGIPAFLIGHITKEGNIAGPKVLEHMVDVVLQFEGERTHSYRVLRGIKNRFGSTNEIGIFEMTENGLREVTNPSEVFLSQRNYGASGCVISAAMEGSRPILIETQGLTSSSNYGVPQRVAMGLDYKRLNILIAVIEKKLGLYMNKSDIFINIAGGVRIDEPAVDLAVAMSIYSSMKDIPVDSESVVLGEVGLSGEIRTISYIDRRISEAAKLGFKRIVMPKSNMKNVTLRNIGAELIGVDKIFDAVDKMF